MAYAQEIGRCLFQIPSTEDVVATALQQALSYTSSPDELRRLPGDSLRARPLAGVRHFAASATASTTTMNSSAWDVRTRVSIGNPTSTFA